MADSAASAKPKVFSHDKDSYEQDVVDALMSYKRESDVSKRPRLRKNQFNWDLYHGRGQFRRKRRGQSKEFLHKSALAAEQITAFFKSALLNFDKWIEVKFIGDTVDDIFDPETVQKILTAYLEKANIKTVVSDGVKVGLHEGHVTVKRSGQMVSVPRFVAKGNKLMKKDAKAWRLVFTVMSTEDYFPDAHPSPNGDKLYEDHQILQEKFKVTKMAEAGDYDKDLVKDLESFGNEEAEKRKKKKSYSKYKTNIMNIRIWLSKIYSQNKKGKLYHTQPNS